jgi:DNA polymerase
MAKPRAQPNYDMRWTPITAGPDFERFYAYNRQDVVAELAACARVPDMTPKEHRIWLMHMRCNERGMYVAMPDVENCLVIVEAAFAKYTARLRDITNGRVQTASEVQEILAWLRDLHGIRMYDLDDEAVTEALKHTDYPTPVREVLRIRQQLAFGSVKKLYAFLHQTGHDGRLRDQYVFYGAHTGLWNGRGVQPANLYSGPWHKPEQVEAALAVIAYRSLEMVEAAFAPMDALEVVASCLRSLIVARPGSRLMGSDFSAIQAVVLAALAGEEWRLEVFRTHGKIYEMSAAKISGVPFEEMLQYRDPKTGEPAKHPLRQTVGKVAELASGFAGWLGAWKRFGADEFMGSDEEIRQAILKWRRESPMVVELWGGQTRNKFNRDLQGNYIRNSERPELFGLEGAAISAVMNPGTCFKYRQVAYQMHEDALYCMGPSGTFMTYHNPRLSPATREYASPWEQRLTYMGWDSMSGWSETDLYTGILTQNIDSHESREIQAEKLVRLEDAGYDVVMHTHDEDVCEVPDGFGSLAEYLALCRVGCEWARTPDGKPWPIKVPDAWEGPSYGKWELKGNEPGYALAA